MFQVQTHTACPSSAHRAVLLLQGIKKGIIEVADIICVTKADGATKLAASQAQAQYAAAVKLLCTADSAWSKSVMTSSARSPESVKEVCRGVHECCCGPLAGRPLGRVGPSPKPISLR